VKEENNAKFPAK